MEWSVNPERNVKHPFIKLAVTDICPEDVASFFRLQREPPLLHRVLLEVDKQELPGHLVSLLADYELACGYGFENEALVRPCLDAILLTTLATHKRQQLDLLGEDPASYESGSIKSLDFQFEKHIKLAWTYNKEKYIVTGTMDYSLWYGCPPVRECNLVVIEAKSLSESGRCEALAYMAMLLHARKFAGRSDTVMHGIATNGNRWEFVRIDAQSQMR
ncbi:hypothetical protein FE257_003903 [Aspergillus nanangensis]|uniref:Uncharacterized protein n=1 Tax=Aspergillus nanangensis TaxID=2582783 RepID=A0AAD4CTG5_ASPNN|nr:hypothetical protein FE257_003903 [Aspergillus nanangensis]